MEQGWPLESGSSLSLFKKVLCLSLAYGVTGMERQMGQAHARPDTGGRMIRMGPLSCRMEGSPESLLMRLSP